MTEQSALIIVESPMILTGSLEAGVIGLQLGQYTHLVHATARIPRLPGLNPFPFGEVRVALSQNGQVVAARKHFCDANFSQQIVFTHLFYSEDISVESFTLELEKQAGSEAAQLLDVSIIAISVSR